MVFAATVAGGSSLKKGVFSVYSPKPMPINIDVDIISYSGEKSSVKL